jgi:two-component system sensor histidine kinase/response regulator
MPISKLLRRQLQRAFGDEASEGLEGIAKRLDVEVPSARAAQLRSFLDMVDEAYVEFERDLDLRGRSLEVSSRELTEAYERLRIDADELVMAVHSLRETAQTLARAAGLPDFSAEHDSLRAMTQVMAELAHSRTEAVEALRASQERYQIAIAHSGIGLWDLDVTTGNMYRSDEMLRMVGYEPGEISPSLFGLLVPEDARSAHEALQRHLEDDRLPLSYKWRMLTKSGGTIWAHIQGHVCGHDANGKPTRMIGTITDISAQREAAESMRLSKEAAESSNRAKSDFLANMSHEIRTPMNGILGLTELCLDTPLNEDQRDYLGMVQTSALSLMTIINDILDFSKIEAGKLVLDPSDFSLREVVNESIRALAMQAHEKGLELTISVAADVPDHLISDATRLRQVLLNLVGNAVKFTEEGEVSVSVSLKETRDAEAVLEVAVRDTGIGIDEGKLGMIFESFSQADTSTTRRFGGTGLGLTISSRIVELLGGRLQVASKLGEGSTFTFSFAAPYSSAALGSKVRWSAKQLVGLGVLIVDDNATNRRILQDLVRNWGMRPELASSASEALRVLRTQRSLGRSFALLLLDAQMPDLDGFALAEQIRIESLQPQATIMMLSSMGLGADRARLANLGISQALTKPVGQDDLLAAILEALGAKHEVACGDTQPLTRRTQERALRVLLAEDNVINQRLAMRLLAKLGHVATLADNGAEAAELIRASKETPFDLVLMDLQMPKMGGFEATERIRALERERGTRTPIVAMTAHAMQGDRERCLDAGMDDYVAKPIVFTELARAIEATTRSVGPAIEPPPATVSELEVFDYPAALARMGDDVELFRELAQLFVERVDRYTKALRMAHQEGNAAACAEVAHAYRGAVSNFGAPRVVSALQAIEASVRAGKLQPNDPHIDDVMLETARFVAALRSIL